MRLLIVDDHTIVRDGLRRILEAASRSHQIGEATNGAEALDRVRAEKWDVVILDLGLPDRSGLDVIRRIRELKPDLPVLILSMHAQPQYVTRALKSGAAGYVTKESASQDLVRAVERVSRGERYITPALAEQLAFDSLSDRGEKPHERLSDREFEVLRLIASGKSLTEIAEWLFLSVKTVSTYRSRLLQKLGMRNTAELIQYAIVNDLLDAPEV